MKFDKLGYLAQIRSTTARTITCIGNIIGVHLPIQKAKVFVSIPAIMHSGGPAHPLSVPQSQEQRAQKNTVQSQQERVDITFSFSEYQRIVLTALRLDH